VRKLTCLHLALNPHLTEGPKGEGRGEKLGRSLASPKTMQQNAARPDFTPAGSDVQCQVCDDGCDHCGDDCWMCTEYVIVSSQWAAVSVIPRRSRASLLGIDYCIYCCSSTCVRVKLCSFYSRPCCWG
jgi:hypothetical protein